MNTAMFVGRFQPFHKGHMEVVKNILKKYDHVYIVIGSSRKSHTSYNPFTAGERWRMIRWALGEEDIDMDKYNIFQVADANEGTVWRQRLINHLPPFDVVVSELDETSRLFREAGYEIDVHQMYVRNILSGTGIRDKMKNWESDYKMIPNIPNQLWWECVPDGTANVLLEIDGVQRVKELNGVE